MKEKIKRFYSNKAALVFAGIWAMHLLGMLWTSDLPEGVKDLRIKLPILLMAVVMAGNQPLSAKQFRWVLFVFAFAILCGTAVSTGILAGIIVREVNDIRDVFIYHISHIRFALFTVLSIFSLYWLAIMERKDVATKFKLLAAVVSLWFLSFLILIESMTGLIAFGVVGVCLLLYYATRKNRLVRLLAITCLVLSVAGAFLYVRGIVTDFYKVHPYPLNLSDTTARGNAYEFKPDETFYENGYPVWVYVNQDELAESWNEKSKFPYDSLDERGQELRYTLIRFLASKGLRKDAEGLNQLSSEEIRLVERGIANIKYQDVSSVRIRIEKIVWQIDQYRKGANPGGHSVTQRLLFWKAGWGIAEDHLLTGIGTGDLKVAFASEYENMRIQLAREFRLRSHNQYLSILIAFGIPGLLYFLFALLYPVLFDRKQINFLFVVFLILALLSMITEDTLETQPGATFVGFWFCYFLFAKPKE